MNTEYYTISQYVESKPTYLDKIKAYDTLIASMETAMLNVISSGQGEYAEYEMDDGQMKVRARYRSVNEMQTAITGLEKIRERYVNKYNGRCVRLVGGNLLM